MKYKRLTNEELVALEKEFINFLASAQITGIDWEKMKSADFGKAEELIDVFSDLVYEKVMGKINYLEFRDKKTLNIFHFTEDKIMLVGLRVKENDKLDLMAENVFEQWTQSNSSSVNIVKTEKKYLKERGEEVFDLLQTGCFITDDKLFKAISNML